MNNNMYAKPIYTDYSPLIIETLTLLQYPRYWVVVQNRELLQISN